jgi:hypothetical protein
MNRSRILVCSIAGGLVGLVLLVGLVKLGSAKPVSPARYNTGKIVISKTEDPYRKENLDANGVPKTFLSGPKTEEELAREYGPDWKERFHKQLDGK